ncbi:MAG TPA: prolyl oligopeptidase family serine peptidase [Fimbriimonadaceae bacterium]|nr:prolyl oligopeptidase family serine peptidase [Fimbriimonadaceae bacterium]
MHARKLVLISLTAGAFVLATAQSIFDPNSLSSDLKFDDLFPRKSYLGRGAQGVEFSHDDRYLGYLWNPYDTLGGNDLWLYDTQEGRSRKLSSIELFAEIDAETARAIERYKKDKQEEEERLKLEDIKYREEVQKRRQEDEKRKEPLPTYPGISSFEWAHKSNELLLTYRGDIFRWKLGDAKPTRLTKTRDTETQVEWLPDDSGFTFLRGEGVYRVKFDSPMVEQLNPKMPDGVRFGGYFLSPDGNRIAIFGSKAGPPVRQVDWIVYRERFAEARKTSRGVSDDDFSGESMLYTFNIAEDAKGDGKPFEVWKWAGGEEWQETSVNDKPWSPDSKRLTFASWKRDKKELFIHVIDLEAKKNDIVWKTTSDGEHRTPSLAAPFFTPDGKQIVLLTDLSGWRHAHVLDPAAGGARQLTQGSFECYPLEMSKDGKSLFVRATKEHPSRQDIYRVDFSSGAMSKLTPDEGWYQTPVLGNRQEKLAVAFSSWDKLNELNLVENGRARQVTESHNSTGFFKNIKQKPRLFEYKNRHGHTVNGFMFLPPGHQKTDKRPLMVYVYGGPLGEGHSVQQGAFNTTAYLFNMYLTHVLGYVTVTIDPRGQSGYGAVFGKANWDNPGVPQVEDLSDGVKHLVENYGVDPAKVAINGWSFGGWQTLMCMLTAPDVFTLGIAGAGPTEWQNYNTWYTGGVITNSPKGDPKPIDKFSVTHKAQNLKSPLMLLHGVEDTNVLYQDTIMLYRKLLQFGKGPLVELSIDPTGGHGMGGDMNNRDRHAIYLTFILKQWGLPAGLRK